MRRINFDEKNVYGLLKKKKELVLLKKNHLEILETVGSISANKT